MMRGALHQSDLPGNLVGAATAARPVAVLFRLFACAKEYDIAAKRPARRAGGAAVDVRRTHSEDKGPIRA